MGTFLHDNEAVIRLSSFIAVFVAFAVWEVLSPRRALHVSKRQRWTCNIALVVINTLILRFLVPVTAVGMALFATEQEWGMLNYWQLPLWLATLIGMVVLDLTIWLQHVTMHAVPVLWRLHRVHHADLDFDLTTGARFHPLEIILSMLVKIVVIAALGPPVVAVILFEVLLNSTAIFNHSNIRLPDPVDRLLRRVLVTPDMHRVHHSIEEDETNSNFGFNLSWWDRLFGTYRDQPRAGHEGMTIGIEGFREAEQTSRLPSILTLPFRGQITGYAINRRQFPDKDGQDG